MSSTREIHAGILRAVGAGALGQILNVASRLLLIPLFLSAWGAPAYGEWLMLTSFVAYLSLMEFGGQVYIVNLLTQAASANDVARFREVLQTGLALFLVIPLTGLAIFVLCLTWVPVESWFGLATVDENTARWVLVLLGVQTAIAIPQGLLTGIYRAIGLLPRGIMFNNAIVAMQLVSILVALWLGQGMVTVALLQLLPFPLIAFAAILDLGKRLPSGMISMKQARAKAAWSFFTPSLHFFSIQLSQALSIQGTLLVVGGVLGPAQVAVFGTVRTVTNIAKQLLGLVSHAAWPDLTRAEASGNMHKLVDIMTFVLRSTLLVSCSVGLFLHVFGIDLVRLWVGAKLEFSQTLLDMFLLIMLMSVFWTVCGNVLMAINKHQGLSRLILAHSIISVLFALTGAKFGGMEGGVAGMLAAEILLPLWGVPCLMAWIIPEFRGMFFIREGFPSMVVIAATAFSPWAGFACLSMLAWHLWRAVRWIACSRP